MFRVISLNANGIRAAARKGFFDWLPKQDADVVCIQETKAQAHQLGDDSFSPAGYHCYYEDAEKKGYSGVAIYTKHKPKKVVRGYGDEDRITSYNVCYTKLLRDRVCEPGVANK